MAEVLLQTTQRDHPESRSVFGIDEGGTQINGKLDVLRLIAIWEKLTDEPYFHATRTIEKEVRIKVYSLFL